MKEPRIPELSMQEMTDGLFQASHSIRRRHPKILHHQGAEFNRVFNFMMQDSYMQPHLHPGNEKIEEIYLIQGKIAVFFFNNRGAIGECTLLEDGLGGFIEVPAFTWHTYVMLSESAITYETMMGVYEPHTWKKFAEWAPKENSFESLAYLHFLKEKAMSHLI